METECLDGLPPGCVAQMTQKESLTCLTSLTFLKWLYCFAMLKVTESSYLPLFDGYVSCIDSSTVDEPATYDVTLSSSKNYHSFIHSFMELSPS
jgi:hypothetical protein